MASVLDFPWLKTGPEIQAEMLRNEAMQQSISASKQQMRLAEDENKRQWSAQRLEEQTAQQQMGMRQRQMQEFDRKAMETAEVQRELQSLQEELAGLPTGPDGAPDTSGSLNALNKHLGLLRTDTGRQAFGGFLKAIQERTTVSDQLTGAADWRKRMAGLDADIRGQFNGVVNPSSENWEALGVAEQRQAQRDSERLRAMTEIKEAPSTERTRIIAEQRDTAADTRAETDRARIEAQRSRSSMSDRRTYQRYRTMLEIFQNKVDEGFMTEEEFEEKVNLLEKRLYGPPVNPDEHLIKGPARPYEGPPSGLSPEIAEPARPFVGDPKSLYDPATSRRMTYDPTTGTLK